MGFDILIYDTNNERADHKNVILSITNITYNFSRPECTKYWNATESIKNVTIKQAINSLEDAVTKMLEDNIILVSLYDYNLNPNNKETIDLFVGQFLHRLIILYNDLIKLPRNWRIDIF